MDNELTNWRVLVVDDEEDSIEVVAMVLHASGATVFGATDGKVGLSLFEQEHPTLILTDLSMPEMDGWELLKAIRASEDGQRVPVIALTAHAMVGDKERVMEAGFDGYLGKPLKMFTFLEELTKCLNHIGSSE